MAFVRRKGKAFFLVHNVRRGGKVRQIHLARLGMRARITDEVVRQVSKKHPFVELNWRALREQLNGQLSEQMELADPNSPAIQQLVASLRALNMDLADFFPPLLKFSESPVVRRSCWCSCGCCNPPSRSSSSNLTVDAGDLEVRPRRCHPPFWGVRRRS